MTSSERQLSTEQVWRELSDRLRHFVRSRGVSAADADDILQNVFLRIHQNLANLRQEERVESWVFQITRNAVADHFRSKPRTSEDVESLPIQVDDQSLGNLNSEIAGCVASLIDNLPEDQRRAVSLYELEGIPQKEIAAREAITLTGAKSRIQRGRKNLEAMLRACCQFQFDQRGNVLECEQLGDDDCGDGNCESAKRQSLQGSASPGGSPRTS